MAAVKIGTVVAVDAKGKLDATGAAITAIVVHVHDDDPLKEGELAHVAVYQPGAGLVDGHLKGTFDRPVFYKTAVPADLRQRVATRAKELELTSASPFDQWATLLSDESAPDHQLLPWRSQTQLDKKVAESRLKTWVDIIERTLRVKFDEPDVLALTAFISTVKAAVAKRTKKEDEAEAAPPPKRKADDADGEVQPAKRLRSGKTGVGVLKLDPEDILIISEPIDWLHITFDARYEHQMRKALSGCGDLVFSYGVNPAKLDERFVSVRTNIKTEQATHLSTELKKLPFQLTPVLVLDPAVTHFDVIYGTHNDFCSTDYTALHLTPVGLVEGYRAARDRRLSQQLSALIELCIKTQHQVR